MDYLGDYEYPPVNGAPLPAEIKRVVGFHDVGIPDGSLMDFTYNVTEKMRDAFLNTMKHAKSLGADEITFANYILFSDFEKAELEPLTNSALQPEDFRFIAVHAKELGLNTTLYLNLGPESSYTRESSPGIPSGDWLATQVRNWGPFVLEQAQLCEETGVDAMMINHLDWDPSVKGYEDVYQAEMLALLSKVRTVYHGRVLMVINPFWGADLNKLSRLLGSVDGFIYDALIQPFWESGDKTVSVSNVKALYLKAFRNLSEYFSGFSKPYLIRLLIQSEKTFLENGWNEDMFRVRRGDDPYYQRNLEVDFSVQAIAYEAALEAVKQAHADRYMEVYGVDTTGYLFMDVILPYISQPQISQSVRNKPAEAVVYQWFKHPAAILLRSLQVSKSLVKSGEEVTVNATLENSGDLPGNYTLVFSLDGIQKDSSTITLDGGKTVTKTMKFSSSVEGTHTVTVGSESVVFNVEKTPVAQTGIDGYPI